MTEFKIDDKVKFIEIDEMDTSRGAQVGDIVTITKVDSSLHLVEISLNSTVHWWVYESQMELIPCAEDKDLLTVDQKRKLNA